MTLSQLWLNNRPAAGMELNADKMARDTTAWKYVLSLHIALIHEVWPADSLLHNARSEYNPLWAVRALRVSCHLPFDLRGLSSRCQHLQQAAYNARRVFFESQYR